MSAYSTFYITRGKAKKMILSKIMGDASDDMLKMFIDNFLESRLYRCLIVDDDEENDDEEI